VWLLAREFKSTVGKDCGALEQFYGVYIIMSKLPIVKSEIGYSLYRTIKGIKEPTDEQVTYLEEFWAEFKKDQPELAKLIIKEMGAFSPNKKAMAAYAHGVWLCYAALKSQQEADEMNENWGI
jgi:hypothetical protein